MILSGELHTNSNPVARIFNIQRYSLNDGRGIRTVIFFKGCPHHCPWCANPESISSNIQIIRRKNRCINCATCHNEVAKCPSGALEAVGYDIALADLIALINKDELFFRTSGGGVTLSGGEVLLQAKFASLLLQQLKKLGINAAIETAGDHRFETLLSVAKYCDEVLFDFKIMDKAKAKSELNIHLSRVLNNFTKLYHYNANHHRIKLIPRLPLIPGYTLSKKNVLHVLAFLKPLAKITEIHLLPFHQYGEPKYQLIHQPYTMKSVKAPSEFDIDTIKNLVEHHGYTVVIGG